MSWNVINNSEQEERKLKKERSENLKRGKVGIKNKVKGSDKK